MIKNQMINEAIEFEYLKREGLNDFYTILHPKYF